MKRKTALVLSGGGMFGAWQAGAWLGLSETFQPDLVVGASVGALNGYAIASGWTPQALCDLWHSGRHAALSHLEETARFLTSNPLRTEFALVMVDILRMKPVTVAGADVTWKHLVASCAVPALVRPRRIDGNWYLDGGLLNPLPVWAAADLGAIEITALHALPEFPSAALQPFVRAFRAVLGYQPKLPAEVQLTTLTPSSKLGSLKSAVLWDAENAARWIAQGERDSRNISISKCLER